MSRNAMQFLDLEAAVDNYLSDEEKFELGSSFFFFYYSKLTVIADSFIDDTAIERDMNAPHAHLSWIDKANQTLQTIHCGMFSVK